MLFQILHVVGITGRQGRPGLSSCKAEQHCSPVALQNLVKATTDLLRCPQHGEHATEVWQNRPVSILLTCTDEIVRCMTLLLFAESSFIHKSHCSVC